MNSRPAETVAYRQPPTERGPPEEPTDGGRRIPSGHGEASIIDHGRIVSRRKYRVPRLGTPSLALPNSRPDGPRFGVPNLASANRTAQEQEYLSTPPAYLFRSNSFECNKHANRGVLAFHIHTNLLQRWLLVRIDSHTWRHFDTIDFQFECRKRSEKGGKLPSFFWVRKPHRHKTADYGGAQACRPRRHFS